jgi:PPM family protein phosphatase
MPVRVLGATDVGLVRSSNEDSYDLWIPEEGPERERRGILLVVADGMGGALAGEEASLLAVRTVVRAYREAPGPDPLEDLVQALTLANTEVHTKSQSGPEFYGMGTTCTAVVIRGRDILLAHVGDSRAYLADSRAIRCLSRDHSLVAEMVRQGEITPDQARVHPHRNIVTRAVGVGATVEIDATIKKGLFQGEAVLLLSSDGLHGVLSDEEIWDAVKTVDRESICATLIRRANAAGGPDNITVLAAWTTGPAAGDQPSLSSS